MHDLRGVAPLLPTLATAAAAAGRMPRVERVGSVHTQESGVAYLPTRLSLGRHWRVLTEAAAERFPPNRRYGQDPPLGRFCTLRFGGTEPTRFASARCSGVEPRLCKHAATQPPVAPLSSLAPGGTKRSTSCTACDRETTLVGGDGDSWSLDGQAVQPA